MSYNLSMVAKESQVKALYGDYVVAMSSSDFKRIARKFKGVATPFKEAREQLKIVRSVSLPKSRGLPDKLRKSSPLPIFARGDKKGAWVAGPKLTAIVELLRADAAQLGKPIPGAEEYLA